MTTLEPLEQQLGGRRKFAWQTGLSLAESQFFELVFWPADGDAMRDGFGPVGSVKETAVIVDLDSAADALIQLEYGKDYLWGVLLVEIDPSYRRLSHLATGARFQLSGGGSGGDGASGTGACEGCGGR